MQKNRLLAAFMVLLVLAFLMPLAPQASTGNNSTTEIFPSVCDVGSTDSCSDNPVFIPDSTVVKGNATSCTCIAFFYSPTCEHCHKVDAFLTKMMNEKYPGILVKKYDVTKKTNAELKEALDVGYGVPVSERGFVPAVYIGDRYIIGEYPQAIEAALNEYANCGLMCPTDKFPNHENVTDIAQRSIIERFKSFGPLAILFAGLVDSINPCAIAGIIFFISYLGIIGKKGKEILIIGGLYSLGVFTAYLGLGWGIFQFIQHLSAASEISKAIYPVTALITAILTYYTVMDYFKARQGKTEEMTLQLPEPVKAITHNIMRTMANMKALVVVAFFAGLLVSLFEFLCTGQVYLPTLVYIMGIPELRSQATLYLLLYNLLFITPLVIIFVAAYLGTTSRDLQALLVKHAASVKALTALLFILLTAYMLLLSAQLYGLIALVLA